MTPRRVKVSGTRSAPHCHRCRGKSELIEGDGQTVCRLCIALLGRIARDPDSANEATLAGLMERHRDVVRLVAVHGTGRLAWTWLP